MESTRQILLLLGMLSLPKLLLLLQQLRRSVADFQSRARRGHVMFSGPQWSPVHIYIDHETLSSNAHQQ